MKSWKTRSTLENATAVDEVLATAEGIVAEHYARIRNLYDEPTIGECDVLARMGGER